MIEEAMKVWRDAYTAYAKAYINPNPQKSPSSIAAAAVIAAAMAADKAEIARLRDALGQIASCQTSHPGDVVCIARESLGGQHA